MSKVQGGKEHVLRGIVALGTCRMEAHGYRDYPEASVHVEMREEACWKLGFAMVGQKASAQGWSPWVGVITLCLPCSLFLSRAWHLL